MATDKDLLLRAMTQANAPTENPQQTAKQTAQSAASQSKPETQTVVNPQDTRTAQQNTANTIGAAMNTVSKNQPADAKTTAETMQQKVETWTNPNRLSLTDMGGITDAQDWQAVMAAKEAWSNATTDEDRAAAREQAERIRAKYGYSGGTDGSMNIRLDDTDMQLNEDDRYELLKLKNAWYEANAKGDTAGKQAAQQAAQKIRAKYGYIANPVSGGYVPLGLYTDPNTGKQYVASSSGEFVRTNPYPVTITDADGKVKELVDNNGNRLTSDMLVIGENGRTYIAETGQLLKDVADQYGINDSNTRILVNGKYYSITGFNTTDQMGALGINEWTDNDIYNELYQSLSQLGLERTPFVGDYDTLTWDQALARATQQLNVRYDKALNDSMDQLNRAALKTGFFGQLPTEALKAQAAASTELERQGAINDLASTLMNDSRSEAQRLYEDDTKSVQQQMDTIMQLYNYLYKLNQDAIDQGEDATRLDQSQQQIDITREQNTISKEELLLKAAQIMDELLAEGFSAPQVSAWLSAQE